MVDMTSGKQQSLGAEIPPLAWQIVSQGTE